MNEIINQVKRMFSDDGRGDKDFTAQEIELKKSKDNLDKAISDFQKAANGLYNSLLNF